MHLTPDILVRCTGTTLGNATRFAEHLDAGCARFGINTPSTIAGLLGQVAIESESRGVPLATTEEDLAYTTADRLRTVYPSLFVKRGYNPEHYVRNPAALSALRYQGYHGRGLIQLTWRETYLAAGLALGYDYVNQPELVLQPSHAALTACWFFAAYKRCLPVAERGDIYTLTGMVNGEARHKLAERKSITVRAYEVLK